jgi:hypothetical protein
VLDAERGTILLHTFHGFLEDLGRVDQLELLYVRKDIFIHEMRLLRPFLSFIVIDLGVYSNFGLIFTPFSNEKLVFVMVEVTALAFTLSIDPVSFKMVSVSLSQDTVTVAFTFVPLSLINVFGGVNHTAFSLRLSVDPVAIVTISIGVEEGTTTMASVFIPVTGVFTPQIASIASPLSALSVLLVHSPHAFVFISILIILNSEAFLAVISPVADVPGGVLPLLSFYSTVFLFLLLFDPVHRAMGSILLSFIVRSNR